MAILFMDGFEIDFPDHTAGLWDAVALDGSPGALLSVIYSNSPVRTGSGSVTVLSGSTSVYSYLSKTITSRTEIYIGFGFYWHSSLPLAANNIGNICPIMTLASNTGAGQVMLGIDVTSNLLKVFKQQTSGTLLGTGTHAIASNTQYYVEIHIVVSDVAGVVDVRVNNDIDIAVSAVDTNTAGSDIVSIAMGIPRSTDGGNGGGAGKFTFDDFIICDTSGSVANSWPNGAGIEKLDPSANGNYSQWTSTGGVNDYTEVDDVNAYGSLPDGLTTALSHQTVNERTSVAVDNTTIIGTVLGIMLLSNVQNTAAGADQMAQFIRIAGIDYDQATFVPPTSFAWHTDILTLNPATGIAFTPAEIDAIEMGWVVK